MKKTVAVIVDTQKMALSAQEVLAQKAFEEFACQGGVFFDLDESQISSENQTFQDEITFYFSPREGALFIEEFKDQFNMQIKEVENRDWNKIWRKSFQVIPISSRLKVIPEWKKKNPHSKDEIYIYPGMGFGTGTHETTFSCLKMFDKLRDQNLLKGKKSCLDFGCGSGILGITAIKQCSMMVDFVDIDPDSLDNCLHNLKINEFHRYSQGHALVLRERYKIKKYDLIFANILESVLLQEADCLLKGLLPGGLFIASGFLNYQKQSIEQCYSQWKLIDSMEEKEWCTLCFRREN